MPQRQITSPGGGRLVREAAMSLYHHILISGTGRAGTTCSYPTLGKDPEYLFKKLQAVFPKIDHTVFLNAFKQTVQPVLLSER
jgi:hypothetical protein